MHHELKRVSGDPTLTYVDYIPKQKTCPFPLLFVHGIGGSLNQFNLSMKCALRHGLEVFALNLQGHGPGQEPNGFDSIVDYEKNIVSMLQQIGRPTILVGHSLGALASQSVAVAWSNSKAGVDDPSVKGAVFMSSDPPKGISFFLKEMLLPRYLWPMLSDGKLLLLPKHVHRLMMNKTPRAEDYLRYINAVSGRAVLEIATGAIQVNEENMDCLTLVIASGEDLTTSPAMQEKIAAKYGSHFELIPGGDHFTFMWSTEPILKIINWIRSNKWFCPGVDLFPEEQLLLKTD